MLGKSIGFDDITAQRACTKYKVVQAKYTPIPGEGLRTGGIRAGLLLLGDLKKGNPNAKRAWKTKSIMCKLVNRERAIIDFIHAAGRTARSTRVCF
jgi:hypothetical protein